MRNKCTVHIVDDDQAVRNSLRSLLEAAAYQVKVYPDGHSFLRDFDPTEFDCVLLDIDMPGLNGLEVQERMLHIHNDLPILFVTANGDLPVAVKAIAAGAFDCIEKPYRGGAILKKVRDALASVEERIPIGTDRPHFRTSLNASTKPDWDAPEEMKQECQRVH